MKETQTPFFILIMEEAAVEASQTTFENPIEDTGTVPDLNRTVTIFASGTVTVDGSLEEGTITLKQEDIRKAIGVGEDQYIPPLSKHLCCF